ncbi:MAG TPA: DNA methyltransferase [Saprospiraceae bacterium]|nr:DNA methyltransferase [Saprospiraceae bacterium]
MIDLFGETSISNYNKNKLLFSDRSFHDWYRFVLSYPPHLVRDYIKYFNLDKSDLILDPFCGTGTTIVEGKLHGIPSIGIEANPFAHFASTVKTDWEVDVNELRTCAVQIREKALLTLKLSGISDAPSLNNLNVSNLFSIQPEKNKLILKDSISPVPLHKVMVLFDCIKAYKNKKSYQYLMLALGNSIVYEISNLKFGPEVGVGKIKPDVFVVKTWYNQVVKIALDLETLNGEQNTFSEIILGDSRNIAAILNGKKISAVITSPPYPNEKDYTRTTRLESVLLEFINSDKELKLLKKTLLRSNTRGVYKEDTDDHFVQNISEVQRIAKEIEDRRIELGKTSGFEKLYHKVTKLYFGGMTRHLEEMKTVLRQGANLAYVVGDQASYLRVMIRTGHLLGEIAESMGYELMDIVQFRTRFSTATKDNLNEEVVILRWNG